VLARIVSLEKDVKNLWRAVDDKKQWEYREAVESGKPSKEMMLKAADQLLKANCVGHQMVAALLIEMVEGNG
jgi:hypothetical protein